MTYRIGQRVRYVGPGALYGKTATVHGIRVPVGWFARLFSNGPRWADASIRDGVGRRETAYLLDVDGLGKRNWAGQWYGSPAYWLRPITDPLAEQFVARLKKLSKEPVLPRAPVFFGD